MIETIKNDDGSITNGGFGGKSFAVLFGALDALLMTPLILSMCIIIYQCVNAIV